MSWLANAQNLIQNGGFEDFDKCPENYVIKNEAVLIPHWLIPTGGTPDYFNSCSLLQVGVPQNFMGYCLPRDGQAYAGLILLFDPPRDSTKAGTENYREYLQTEFTSRLIKGKVYNISLFFSIATYSTFAINRLGVYISEKKIRNKRSTKILHFTPQIAIDTLAICLEQDTWIELSGKFHAKGGERYFTIGNFYDDNHTKYLKIENNDISAVVKKKIQKNRIAYYYIDKVSVTLATK